MPGPSLTSVHCGFGRLGYAEYRTALERIRGVAAGDAELIPEAFHRLFGRESVPDPDPSHAPAPAELRAVFDRVHRDLGYAALSGGKIQDAISLFKRNVEANPNSANAHDSLSEGYAKAGMWKDAARASDRAAALAVEFDRPNRSYFVDQAKKMNERLKQGSEDPK